jgi:Cupredoxin-like domain
MKNKIIASLIAIFAIAFSTYAQENATLVKLTQTSGRFEGKEIKLKSGSYQFEVTNKGVDHEVAFFLQKESDKTNKEFSSALANSGLPKLLKNGETAKTGVVELTAGKYVYSCPLNPTPHYTIVVE